MCSWCRKFNWTVFPVMFLLVPYYYIIYFFKKGVCGVLPHSTCILKLQTGVFAFAPAFYNRLLSRIFRVWPWECIFGVTPRVDEAENTICWCHAVACRYELTKLKIRFVHACLIPLPSLTDGTPCPEYPLTTCFLFCFSLDSTTVFLIGTLDSTTAFIGDHAYWCNGAATLASLSGTQIFYAKLDSWENQRWYKIINHSGGV
jgi:hypothetical protein